MHQYSLLHLPPPPVITTLSLHDALPISVHAQREGRPRRGEPLRPQRLERVGGRGGADDLQPQSVHPDDRSEEHTSELQSQSNLVCRLLLEKKNEIQNSTRGVVE